MQFIITIDTEGDNQWDHGRVLTVENIKFVPRFQALCDDYGIKPTYLVTSEVCQDSYARDLFERFISDKRAEIGAHLHSWTTPPFMDCEGFRENDANHAFASELPYDLLNDKIANLTEQISASFGKRPTS
ncbi:MAG TPA: deacetylase, partial [Bacteroidales bacterium]|nr:deacetylase [Bacteroidales bacterium]